jgi:hypothetical protein
MVIYQLMNKDNRVLEFIKADTLEGQFKITKEYENQIRPYLIETDSNELDTWFNNRAIPTSREHIDRVLQKFQSIELKL